MFVFIDDDQDEHHLFSMAMESLELDNKVQSCYNGVEAFKYLRETDDNIFAILADINMPKMDGLELRRMVDMTPELKVKAIPFFFHTNSSTAAEVRAAYAMGIQGYLKKADSLEGTATSLKNIINLWTNVVHPKDLEASV